MPGCQAGTHALACQPAFLTQPACLPHTADVSWQGIGHFSTKLATRERLDPWILILETPEGLTGARPSARACGFAPLEVFRLLRKRRRVALGSRSPRRHVADPRDTNRAAAREQIV